MTLRSSAPIGDVRIAQEAYRSSGKHASDDGTGKGLTAAWNIM